jgi:hypothetical protein
MNVLNFTHTLPKPMPGWARVPQLGHTVLTSSFRSFFNLVSGVTFDMDWVDWDLTVTQSVRESSFFVQHVSTTKETRQTMAVSS